MPSGRPTTAPSRHAAAHAPGTPPFAHRQIEPTSSPVSTWCRLPAPTGNGPLQPPYRTPILPPCGTMLYRAHSPLYSSFAAVKRPSPRGKSFLRVSSVQNKRTRSSPPSPVTSSPSRLSDRRPPTLESGPPLPPLPLLSEPRPPVLPFVLFYRVSLLLDFPMP
jgi:hypothetical protein